MKKEIFSGETDELELDEWVLEDLHPRNNLTSGGNEVYILMHAWKII
jgi:hypothetical protein